MGKGNKSNPTPGYNSNDWLRGGINVGKTTKPYPSKGKGGKK